MTKEFEKIDQETKKVITPKKKPVNCESPK